MASFGAAWQGNYYCQTEIILESQSIANNTSTFLVRVWFGTAAGWWIDANFNAGAYVGGSWVAGFSGVQKYVAGGSSALFVDTRQTRTHNNDGTLTLNISGNVSTNNVVTFNQWSGGDYTFPTIPRATDPNWSGNFEAGTAKTINLPRASSSFTHDVSYSFGSVPMTTIATGAGVTTSWTPDVTLLNQIPNAASGSGTLRVVTKNGGTVIGTKDKSFTLSAAPTVVPSISAVLWDDDNTTVKNNIGAFVKSASRIKGSVTAAGIYGSTITSKGLIVNGSPIPENTTISVETSGTIAASGTATDSRGRTVTQPATFDVLDYAPPKAVTFTVDRTDSTGALKDDGQYLKLTLDASVQSLIVSAAQKNSMKIVVKTRPISSGTWTTRNTINTGLTYNSSVLISGGGIYLASSSYVVRVEITDKVSNTVEAGGYASNKTVATGTVTLDLNGTNVGIGKFHENGKLDVAGDIYSDGTRVSKEDHLHVLSDITDLDQLTVSAILDPSYRVGGPARVLVDGVLSTEAYEWLTSYNPQKGREVELMHKNGTYVILGQKEPNTVALPFPDIVKIDTYARVINDLDWSPYMTATKLPSGLVVLSGLLRCYGAISGGHVITTLPENMRPPHMLIFPILSGDSGRSITIHPDGRVTARGGFINDNYISLDGVAFYPAGVGDWTPIGSGGSSWNTTAWEAHPDTADYGIPSFYKDPWGFVWFRGLVVSKVGMSTDNTNIFMLPESHRSFRELHQPAAANDLVSAIGARPTDGINWKTSGAATAGSWYSLSGIVLTTTDAQNSNGWRQGRGAPNGWQAGLPTYPDPRWLKREDGLNMVNGFYPATGTLNTLAFMLDKEVTPIDGRKILISVQSNQAGRVNIYPYKDTIKTTSSAFAIGLGSSWHAFDGRVWVN